MNNFLFENGTRVLFGGGCVQEYLGSFVKGYGPSVLLITEEGIAAPARRTRCGISCAGAGKQRRSAPPAPSAPGMNRFSGRPACAGSAVWI